MHVTLDNTWLLHRISKTKDSEFQLPFALEGEKRRFGTSHTAQPTLDWVRGKHASGTGREACPSVHPSSLP
jgi:hypothetical protein